MVDFYKDLKATIGDVDGNKYTSGRITTVTYKALNKFNRRHNLNKATYFLTVIPNEVEYTLPSDCLNILSYRQKGIVIPSDTQLNVPSNYQSTTDKISTIVYDRTNIRHIQLDKYLTEPSLEYVIIDDTAQQVDPDFNTADRVIYKDNVYFLFYNNSPIVIPDTYTVTVVDWDVVEIVYIKSYPKTPDLSTITITDNYYDALLYYTASVLLSDDNRNEVREKSAELYGRYRSEIKQASHDNMTSFNPAKMEIPYRSIYA